MIERGAAAVRSGACRVVAVTSGKGGVGKSCLVLNLALVLARMGYRVAVVDGDLGLANLDVLLNALPRHSIADLINGTRELTEVLLTGPYEVRLVPGCSGVYDLANLDPGRRTRLLERLRLLESESNLLFFDTAAGLSRQVLDFVRAAGEFILVTTPEPTALTDAYGILKVISRQGGAGTGHVIVNLIRRGQQGEQTFEKLQRVTRRYLPGMEISYLGGIGYDPVVADSVQSFSPFVLSRPGSAATGAVNRIARRLVYGDHPYRGRPAAPGSFISRLKELFAERTPAPPLREGTAGPGPESPRGEAPVPGARNGNRSDRKVDWEVP